MRSYKQYSYRFLLFFLAMTLILPILSACKSEQEGGESSNDGSVMQVEFSFTLGEKSFAATHRDCDPIDDAIVLYTRAYEREGKPSLTVGSDQPGRTAVCVNLETEDEQTVYRIRSVSEESIKDLIIPYNGFIVSLPTEMLKDLRVRSGQIVEVSHAELLGEAERMDVGYFRPDSEQKYSLQRRILLRDPVKGIAKDGIYFLSAGYADETVSFPAECVIVTLRSVTELSYRVSAVARSNKAIAGSDQLVFVGEYNCVYAETFLKEEQRMTFTNLNDVSSYSDTEALVLNEEVYEISQDKHNNDRITESGIYLYDLAYSSIATPEADVERVDVVIIDDTVVFIGEKNARNMLPMSGGVVVTFAGDSMSVIDGLEVGDRVASVLLSSDLLPEEHVRINGYAYGIDKNNAVRAPEGVTVLYTPEFGKTTQTNQYGIEIAIADGKVVAVEEGVGDIEIPENGCVLSIHKDSSGYQNATDAIKVGDAAVVSLGDRNYSITTMEVSGINSTRFENMLIVYRGNNSTGSNEYGYEIQVDINGQMVGESYSGNAKIPAGGYVLSGHGTSKELLVTAYRYGAKVFFDEDEMQVVMITTPETILNDAAVRLDSAVAQLEQAKQNLLYLDYTALDQTVADLEECVNEAKQAFVTGDFETAVHNVSKVDDAWQSLQYAMIEAHPVENRAIWYRSTEKSDEEVRAVVEKMKSLNINTIYLETWYNGRFIGYSDNELIAHSVYNGSYDAMDGFVRICHENGIEVHAWVQNFFIGTVEAQEQTNQALADHFEGRWLIDRKGKNTYFYSVSNTNFVFLNPYDSEVRTLLIDFYREMITKYDIDGLHLDYIRFPELNYGSDDFGYNDDIVSAWQKANNTTVDPATLSSGALYQSWITFRQEIINSFVAEVYGMVCETDPSIWLSAAVYPGIPDIKSQIFQDCDNWVKNGYMDELFSMSYGADNTYVSENAAKFVKLAGDSCFYSTGISAFGETVPMNFALQMTEVTGVGADGVAIFSLANISVSNYQYPIQEGAFRIPSVQVNRLNETVAAQLAYILDKAKNVYMPYADFSEANYQTLCALLQPIIDNAEKFDLESATLEEQLQYCVDTIDSLTAVTKALEPIVFYADKTQHEIIRADFDDLISWLTKSRNRISARIQ